MHGIEAQTVAVVILQPHECIVDEEAAHFVASFLVEIDCVAPGRFPVWVEIWTKPCGVVADGAEMVINDVEDNAEPGRMAGVDESLESVRAAVWLMRGKKPDTVVTPALLATPRGDGHNLNVGYA